MTIKELKSAIKEEIGSRWGTDPMYFAGSDDATEAAWARADARLLEMLDKIADDASVEEKQTERRRSWSNEDYKIAEEYRHHGGGLDNGGDW